MFSKCGNTVSQNISALSIDPKCTKIGFQIDDSVTDFTVKSIRRRKMSLIWKPSWKSITQKGNAHLGLGQFDEAKECYESLRTLGQNLAADQYLKKLSDAQERD